MQKTLLLGLIILVLMVDASIAHAAVDTDWQGRTCTYGPKHDQCLFELFEKIPGTTDYRDYHSAFQIGVSDAHKTIGPIHDQVKPNETESWIAGWGDGYCSVNQTATGKPLDCTTRD